MKPTNSSPLGQGVEHLPAQHGIQQQGVAHSSRCTAAAGAGSNGPAAPALPVTLLGVGLMGNKIARRLASQGMSVSVWNRSLEKCKGMDQAGITVCSTPADAVGRSSIVVLTLADAATIQATILSPEIKPLLKGKTIVQMGTIGPKESEALSVQVLEAGGAYVEAPVLGSQPEAEKGTLLVMVGAPSDPTGGAVWPVLTALGKEPNYIGPVGTAAAVKLALNQLIASLTIGFSTSLGLVQRSGADVDKFMAILRASALYAPTYDKKLQKMLDRDFGTANFPTKHLLKDVRLFGAEASKAGLDTRLLAALQGVTQDAVARGLENTDYSAVYEAVLFPAGSESSAAAHETAASGEAA